jgi:hypothetical protein
LPIPKHYAIIVGISMDIVQSSPILKVLQMNLAQGIKILSSVDGPINDFGPLVYFLSQNIGRIHNEALLGVLFKIQIKDRQYLTLYRMFAELNKLTDGLREKEIISSYPDIIFDPTFFTTMQCYEQEYDSEFLIQLLNKQISQGTLTDYQLSDFLANLLIYKEYSTYVVARLVGRHDLQRLVSQLYRHTALANDRFYFKINMLQIAKVSQAYTEGFLFIFAAHDKKGGQMVKDYIEYFAYVREQHVAQQVIDSFIDHAEIADTLYFIDNLYTLPSIKKNISTIVASVYENHRATQTRQLIGIDKKHGNSLFYDYLVNNYITIRNRVTNDDVDDFKVTLIDLINEKDLFLKLHPKKRISVINEFTEYSQDHDCIRASAQVINDVDLPSINTPIIVGLSKVNYRADFAQKNLEILLKNHWELPTAYVVNLLEAVSRKQFLYFVNNQIHKMYKNQYKVVELFENIAVENVHQLDYYIYRRIEKLTKPWSESMQKERSSIKKELWKNMSWKQRLLVLVWPF